LKNITPDTNMFTRIETTNEQTDRFGADFWGVRPNIFVFVFKPIMTLRYDTRSITLVFTTSTIQYGRITSSEPTFGFVFLLVSFSWPFVCPRNSIYSADW